MANNTDISHLPTPEELDKQVDISHLPPPEAINAANPEEPSIPETIAHQGAQGLTLGFSDELAGAGNAAKQALTGEGGPKQGRDWEAIKAAYVQMRDAERKRLEEESSAHPVISGAANIVGGIPAAVVAGPSIGAAAGLGAIAGLGSTPDISNVPEAAKDVAIGGGLGAIGGKIAQKLGGATTSEALETAASKLASRSVGIKPSKELTRAFDQESGKVMEGSNIIKGIGKTAMEEGALPLTGGPENIYDKSIDAIDHNYKQLSPVIASVQDKITPEVLESSGNIGDKAADFLFKYRDELTGNPNKDAIIKKLDEKYIPYIEQLSADDGNLSQLNVYKKGLQEAATDLSKAAYDQPAGDLKPEAEFVKRLGGIVRQHIEDVANNADPGAGDQIKEINKTLSNLYTYKDNALKMMNKSGGSLLDKTVDLPAKLITGHKTGTAAGIIGAKALNGLSKAVATPAGDLVQKTVAPATKSAIISPFSQQAIQHMTGGEGLFGSNAAASDNKATMISSNLYNATPESLQQVASKLSKEPGLKFYGEALQKAVEGGDPNEKDRAVFLIMQNPKSRKLISPQQGEK